MITVFFKTDTVEASQTFDADKVDIIYGFGRIDEGLLVVSKEGEDVAQFNSGTWIYWQKDEAVEERDE